MLRSGAIVRRDNRLHAAADHTPVATDVLRVPPPERGRNQNHQRRTAEQTGANGSGPPAACGPLTGT